MSTRKTRRPRRSLGKIHAERSSRYQASYIGPDLARHTAPATFTARMDAEHWLADERRLISGATGHRRSSARLKSTPAR